MPYIMFTEQEKESANSTSIVDYLISHGESVERVGREYVWEAPSGKVSINGSEWYSQYELVGGGAVNFAQKFFGLSYPEAIRSLLGEQAGEAVIGEKKPAIVIPKKPFQLPEKHTDMRRVYGYLMNERLIDRQVINHFVKEGRVSAESVKHFSNRLGHVRLEGVALNSCARSCKHAYGGVRLGSRGVTAVRLHAVLHVHHTLFRDADNCARTLKTGECALNDSATLVEHELGVDAVFLEVIYDVSCAGAVYLLAT